MRWCGSVGAVGLAAALGGCGDAGAPAPLPGVDPPAQAPDGARVADPPALPSPPPGLLSGEPMDWPVETVHITSDFGWRVDPVTGQGTRLHGGVDFRGAVGDPVLAIAAGTVVFAGHDDLLGNHVIVDHGQTVQSFYGHLSSVLVCEGVVVDRGAAVGLVGNTGRSAAPHLHLTIKVGGVAVDPIALLGHPVHVPGALATQPAPPPPISG